MWIVFKAIAEQEAGWSFQPIMFFPTKHQAVAAAMDLGRIIGWSEYQANHDRLGDVMVVECKAGQFLNVPDFKENDNWSCRSYQGKAVYFEYE